MTCNTESSPHNNPQSRGETPSTDKRTTRRAALAAGGASLATVLAGCLGPVGVSGDGSSSEPEEPSGELKISEQTRSGNHVKIDHVSTNVVSRVVIRDADGNERQDGLQNIRPGGPVNGEGFDLELNPVFTETQEVTVELIARDDNAVLAEDTAEIQYKEHILRFAEQPTDGDTEITVYRSTNAEYETKNSDGIIGASIASAKREKLYKSDVDSNDYLIGTTSFSESKPFDYEPGEYGTAVLPLEEEHEDVPLESGTPVYIDLNDRDRQLPWAETITE